MNPRWQLLEEIFQTAADIQPGSSRTAYLDNACKDDPALRAEVEQLLADITLAGTFLETPAIADIGLADKTERLGVYRILKEIGRGGMGTVYEAERDDGTFRQRVAIKLIRRGFDSGEIIQRFQRERQILAMVNHPNIARLLDGGTSPDGLPYFVMELLEGQTLLEHCQSKNLSIYGRLQLFQQVCTAVSHAHQNLIIHRDLKPANIMVTPEGQVKLLDFGIAKVLESDILDPSQTHTSVSLLTPDYASPEQVRRENITTATDVYALGLILSELLTGQKAQRATSAVPSEIERAVCLVEPKKPSEMALSGVNHQASALRGDLDNIVLKALQKEPQRRYQSVTQLSEEIDRYFTGRPIIARPDSLGYRFSKFVSRNRLGVAATALVLLAIGGGIYATLRQARIAQTHFNSVRSLSKSLLNEIDESAQGVAGATKTRTLIVKRSLEYLDRLAQNSGNDPDLMMEAAEAYKSVGSIQGNRNRSNIGDFHGAMVSFRKALDLRRRVEKIKPQPDNRQGIVLTATEAARVFATSLEAAQLTRESVELADQLAKDFPGKYRLPLANAHFTKGYIHFIREELEEAIPDFQKTRDLFVVMNRGNNNLAVCDRYMGHSYLRMGRLDDAERMLKRSQKIAGDFFQAKHTPRARMDWSYDFQLLAQVKLRQGHAEEAMQFARTAETMRMEMAAIDPSDQRTQTALTELDEVMGEIHTQTGNPAKGLELLSKGLDAVNKLLSTNPDSPEDIIQRARIQLAIARAHRALGHCAEARSLLSEAKDIFTRFQLAASLRQLPDLSGCPAPRLQFSFVSLIRFRSVFPHNGMRKNFTI